VRVVKQDESCGGARRRAAATRYPRPTPGAGLLPAGGAGPALVLRERAALTTSIKTITDAPLTDDQRTVNLLHAATRAPAERSYPLLKTTVKALRRVSLCPWRIGAISAAALVLLPHEHGRTTRSTGCRSRYWEWRSGSRSASPDTSGFRRHQGSAYRGW
jgi:hypothetical protein